MFSVKDSKQVLHQLQKQQIRFASRRQIAYPFYKFNFLNRNHQVKHDSNLKYAMRQFLGPKNFKGEYIYNKYYKVPQDHLPNYVSSDLENGQSLVDPITGNKCAINPDESVSILNSKPRDIPGYRKLQPFPHNRHCRTNFILSEDTRLQIYQKIQIEKKSTQEVAKEFNIKIPRIEAVVKLVEVEQKFKTHDRILPQIESMSETLYRMFPVFKEFHKENLSEIPVPARALSSRFMTIAESEPFGPIEAAKVLELEPAIETLQRLSTEGEHSAGHELKTKVSKNKVVYGELLKGEKSQFRFVHKSVGQVGFRYGSGNRDNKKDRVIGFNESGKMIYL